VETETTNIAPLGSHDLVDGEVGAATFRARTEAGFARGEGEKLWVALDPERVHFFDRDSGRSLRKAG
jgi:multiple sugar transport system ATP-binding protein